LPSHLSVVVGAGVVAKLALLVGCSGGRGMGVGVSHGGGLAWLAVGCSAAACNRGLGHQEQQPWGRAGCGHSPAGQAPVQAVRPQQWSPVQEPTGRHWTLVGQASPAHWKLRPSGPAGAASGRAWAGEWGVSVFFVGARSSRAGTSATHTCWLCGCRRRTRCCLRPCLQGEGCMWLVSARGTGLVRREVRTAGELTAGAAGRAGLA
jgi:hypothetical protein